MHQANPETAALFERLRISRLSPHQLTLEQFLALGDALPVPGSDCSWEVSHGRYLSWAEGGSAREALASTHRREVEFALRANLHPAGRECLPSMPSQSVLNDYPDLRTLYSAILQVDGHTEP
ncbi:Hypothetical protein (plasmid) [Pseudomonas putida]|nr:hypothetical protein B7H18_03795 [Pseudomonas putida]QDQ70576.1 hypothetical protein pJBCL41_00256 [Pseudomonas sp.]QIZ22869.1 Hypothetical protein [Pseudomonas putida]